MIQGDSPPGRTRIFQAYQCDTVTPRTRLPNKPSKTNRASDGEGDAGDQDRKAVTVKDGSNDNRKEPR